MSALDMVTQNKDIRADTSNEKKTQDPVRVPLLPDAQSLQDRTLWETNEHRKQKHNGDKNPISPVVSKREEISECEQGKVDWT